MLPFNICYEDYNYIVIVLLLMMSFYVFHYQYLFHGLSRAFCDVLNSFGILVFLVMDTLNIIEYIMFLSSEDKCPHQIQLLGDHFAMT